MSEVMDGRHSPSYPAMSGIDPVRTEAERDARELAGASREIDHDAGPAALNLPGVRVLDW